MIIPLTAGHSCFDSFFEVLRIIYRIPQVIISYDDYTQKQKGS
jgi:hypothetical protein